MRVFLDRPIDGASPLRDRQKAVAVFLPTGPTVKAQLKNVENRSIDADSR
jgi:hypothetical protein